MKKYTLVISSGCLFSNNMGCNALTYGILEILSKVADKLDVKFEYWLFGNMMGGNVPNELKKHDIRILGTLPHLNIRDIVAGIYHRDLKKRLTIAQQLKNAAVFLDNGAGDSFSDIYGPARLNSILRNMLIASACKKPFIFLPQTVGPFLNVSPRQKRLIRKVLSSASAVYTRDPKSTACVHECVPNRDLFETVDVALFMHYVPRVKARPETFTVGINPSGLLWRGGYTGKNEFGLKDDYQHTLRTVVKHLLDKEIAVEFIGHDLSGPNGGTRCDDYYVCKQLQREFPESTVGPFFYGPSEAKSYISGFDMLIGSRMHCCIAAYSSGVPVLPLGYSRKFTGLFEDALKYPHLADLTQMGTSSVIDCLAGLLDHLDAVKNELTHVRRNQIRDWESKLVDDMARQLCKILRIKEGQ